MIFVGFIIAKFQLYQCVCLRVNMCYVYIYIYFFVFIICFLLSLYHLSTPAVLRQPFALCSKFTNIRQNIIDCLCYVINLLTEKQYQISKTVLSTNEYRVYPRHERLNNCATVCLDCAKKLVGIQHFPCVVAICNNAVSTDILYQSNQITSWVPERTATPAHTLQAPSSKFLQALENTQKNRTRLSFSPADTCYSLAVCSLKQSYPILLSL